MPDTVLVHFIDAATGEAFANADMPPDMLPESFAVATTLHLADEPWTVEKAEPRTAAEFVASGSLTLTLRRVETVPVEDILFSLPTIGDGLPVAGPGQGAALVLHEDDWRQVELVSSSRIDAAGEELDAIEAIFAEQGAEHGFKRIHVRSAQSLLDTMALSRIRALLPEPTQTYDGVRFEDVAGVAEGTFAFATGPLTFYGEHDDSGVTVLAFQATEGPVDVTALEQLMSELGLVVIDWCACTAVQPGELRPYFDALGLL